MKLATIALAVAGAALVAVVSGGARAEDAAAVLAQRQDLMKQQAKDMKAIKEYLDGKGELDPAKAAAADLTKTMAQVPSLFPKDTGMGQLPKSEAKPDIWTEWDKFLAAQKTAADKIEKLNAAFASGDKTAIASEYADLGKNGCGNCHQTFRQKKS